LTDTDDLRLVLRPSLDGITAELGPEEQYLSPSGRAFLIAASLLGGVPVGARVLDLACGLGTAAIDLAEAFGCRVAGFDHHVPYIAQAQQTAKRRGVGGRVTLRLFDGSEALATYPHGAYDVVVALGGILNDLFPGGRDGGLEAAGRWLSPGGVLICSDVIAVAPPSELVRAVFGDDLPTEATYWNALAAAGFDLIYAARATRNDFEEYFSTVARLRQRLHPHPGIADAARQVLLEAAYLHPEVGYFNMVARKRASRAVDER
jgi:SAM-dependent methyltransferase